MSGEPSSGSTQPALPARLAVVAGAVLGFFVGVAVVLLHPVFLALARDDSGQLRQLLASSLAILPATMAISIGVGAGCGAYYALLRRASAELAGYVLRMVWPLACMALCLALMFAYDAKVFGYQWFRAALWAAVALVLATAGYALFWIVCDWLRRGALRRVLWAVVVVGLLLWLPFLLHSALS